MSQQVRNVRRLPTAFKMRTSLRGGESGRTGPGPKYTTIWGLESVTPQSFEHS